MQEQFFDKNFGYILMGLIAIALFAQSFVMLRIRNILQAITLNQDSLLYYLRKLATSDKRQKASAAALNTCQFCKHRMAYINTGEGEDSGDDFYHLCALRNIQVRPEDTCQQFEPDKNSDES